MRMAELRRYKQGGEQPPDPVEDTLAKLSAVSGSVTEARISETMRGEPRSDGTGLAEAARLMSTSCAAQSLWPDLAGLGLSHLPAGEQQRPESALRTGTLQGVQPPIVAASNASAKRTRAMNITPTLCYSQKTEQFRHRFAQDASACRHLSDRPLRPMAFPG